MSLVSLDSLKVFCDVARQKSFSRSAEINGVSQSAVSQAVRQLEERLGAQLIDRSVRPLKLTPAGEIYFRECRDILSRYEATEARVRATQTNAEARLRVAAIYSVVLYDMDRHVRDLLGANSNGSVRFQYLHPDDVVESVLSDEADLGLLSFAKPSSEIEVERWREEPMALVCPPDHDLATARRIERLDGADFVAFESGLTIQREIGRYLRACGVSVNPTMAFDNIEFIKRGIESGAGVAILPAATVEREEESGTLAVAPVRLGLSRPLSVIRRRRRPMTPPMSRFIEILQASEATEQV